MSASISMDLFSVASLRFKAFSSSSSTSMSSFAALSFKSTIRSLSSRSDEANFFERSSACKCLCIAVLAKFILRVAVSSSRMDALTSRVFSSNAGFSRWRIFAFASSHFLSTSFNVFKDSFSRVSESTENDFSLVVSLCATCILCRMFSRVSCSALTNFSMALKRTSAFDRAAASSETVVFLTLTSLSINCNESRTFSTSLLAYEAFLFIFNSIFLSCSTVLELSTISSSNSRISSRLCASTDSLSSLFAIHVLLCSLASSVFVFCSSRSLVNRFSTSSLSFFSSSTVRILAIKTSRIVSASASVSR
mmetsp:Transcript_5450/g.18464  ORF Transcript_5450/g.18464 Transcript_5450/m.18464 type:complete len:307 (+) Transcript_5450:1647-2567(+)